MGHELPAHWLRQELPPSEAELDKGQAEGVASSPSHGGHCICWRGSSGSSPHSPCEETEAQGIESTTQILTVHGCTHPQVPQPRSLTPG